jgi:hypothetical protein
MRRKLDHLKIATADFETDPFFPGRVPAPFAGGFYTGDTYADAWGDDCVARLMHHISKYPEPCLIYVHNAARFDFHFMYDYVEEPIFILRGKLIEFTYGDHVFRDSLAIIPIALDQYQKEKINYQWFERTKREYYKPKIREYLKSDCVNLYNLVTPFVARFGAKITIGSTAMSELKKLHTFERATESTDLVFRQYYFGGRTQCFEGGIIPGPWKVYDVNSQYPTAMKYFEHPVGSQWDVSTSIPDDGFFFLEFDGQNRNALPSAEDGKTEFNVAKGKFFACSHELQVAEKAGLVEVEKTFAAYIPNETANFAAFVDQFYAEKVDAKQRGDKPREIFSKLILNAAYGKFGQDPRTYMQYLLLRDIFLDKKLMRDGWKIEQQLKPGMELWSKPAPLHRGSFYNVAIAASITSAARSIMMQGLQQADGPIYCDTDSVICRDFHGAISDFDLGAWKWETWEPEPGKPERIVADYAAIAGRKTYCLYNKCRGRIIPIKWASKGGDLNPSEIVAIARGKKIVKTSDIPTFRLGVTPYFQPRTFRNTIDNGVKSFRL